MSAPVKYVGAPDGPSKFVPELGCEVGTFIIEPGGKFPALTWHVPPHMRGDFRPQDLANFDPQKDYRTDQLGKVLCYGQTQAGNLCSKRAQNRFPRCDVHGGRLHPLDKFIKDDEQSANPTEDQGLSRYRQFQAGQITVDDLDDEELASCGFRAKNGRIYRPRNVPRELANAFNRAIYERAQEALRGLVIDAAQTIGEIMKNKTNEPDIRLKAAITLIERNLGKTPQVVAITDAKAYEEVFDDIIHVRSNRPKQHELPTGQGQLVIDAEFTESIEPRTDSANEPPIEGTGNSAESIDVEPTHGSAGRQDVSDVRHVPQSTSGLKRDELRSDTRDSDAPEGRDSRLFARNDAILAQTIEVKPFEYDLTDKSADVKKATRKRYASRALGVDLTAPAVPFTELRETLPNGQIHIRYIEPAMPKMPSNKNAEKKRKTFTLSDF